MKRRDFMMLLGGAAGLSPREGGAQQPAMPVIGILSSASADSDAYLGAAFRDGLKEFGYSEGRNVAIQYRWAEGHYERLPALAADLVRRQVAVIAAIGGNSAAQAAKAATSVIPIVVTVGSDPVELGLVASLHRPGGNVTGVSLLIEALEAKKLELLREIVPASNVTAMLVNLNNPSADFQAHGAMEAARGIGQRLLVLNASRAQDIDAAFASLVEQGAGALLVGADEFFLNSRVRIAALAARHAIPTIYELREFAVSGGLMSYGPNFSEAYRQAGNYTARILRGTKPADLPVLQPTTFELVVNLKTARALGITIPQSILLRADEVIE